MDFFHSIECFNAHNNTASNIEIAGAESVATLYLRCGRVIAWKFDTYETMPQRRKSLHVHYLPTILGTRSYATDKQRLQTDRRII